MLKTRWTLSVVMLQQIWKASLELVVQSLAVPCSFISVTYISNTEFIVPHPLSTAFLTRKNLKLTTSYGLLPETLHSYYHSVCDLRKEYDTYWRVLWENLFPAKEFSGLSSSVENWGAFVGVAIAYEGSNLHIDENTLTSNFDLQSH